MARTWQDTQLGIDNIDHPVIASRDLDNTRAQFERLGFTVPPRGSHIEWGTGNLCIMFPDDYLEVRGIIDPERFTMYLDEHLEKHGEGLMGVAFGTGDVDASHAEAVERGINAGDLRQLRRNFEHPEGWTQPSFRLYAPSADDIEGLMHVVVIQHLTPDLIRRPDFLEHANGCLGVNEMAGTITGVSSCAGKMRRLLGDDAVSESDDMVVVNLPSGQSIVLAKSASSGLTSLLLRVRSFDDLGALFTTNGIEFEHDSEGRIAIDAAYACGTALRFTEDLPA